MQDVAVQFATEATQFVKLATFTAFTDASGIATVNIDALADAPSGMAAVTAEVPGVDTALELTFNIEVIGDTIAPIRVDVDYTGASNLTTSQLRLFLVEGGKPLCSDVHPDGANAYTPVLLVNNASLTSDNIVSTLPGLETAGQQRWLVQAVAPDEAAPVANGCETVDVAWEQTKELRVVMADLPLRYQGDYTVTTQMDLDIGGSVDGTTGIIINLLLNLFDDPGSVAIEAACKDASGTLSTVCLFLVGSDGKPAGAGVTLAQEATEYFFELIEENLGSGVVVAGTSIADLLKSVSFQSKLKVLAEPSVPDEKGAAFAQNMVTHEWSTLTYTWKFTANCSPSQNDNKCGNESVKLSDIYGVSPFSALSAGVTTNDEFWVDVAAVPGFIYGKILNFLIEKRVLPLLFGDGTKTSFCGLLPAINTYEKLISILFGDNCCLVYDDCCDYFAQKVLDYTGQQSLSFVANPACQLFIPAGGAYIRNEVNKLAGTLTIGTPEASPCPATDLTSNRLVDFLGTDQDPCTWDASFDLNGTNYTPANSFTADKN
jgi:putative component of membrane protein insertase Oxa1/YidC/SpoIIIJ protein YidD